MIAKLKTDCKNVCIVLHKNPDGDAICAARAITLLFRKYCPDKNLFLINDSWSEIKLKFPKSTDELPPWIKSENLPDDTFLLFLDHSDFYYTLFDHNHITRKEIKQKLVIDHHYCYNTYFKLSELFIDVNANSTCEIIYDLAKLTEGIEFDQEIALSLYLGIFSDSCYHATPLRPALLRKINHLLDYCQNVVEQYKYYRKGRFYKQAKQMAYIWRKCTSKKGGFAPVVRLRISHEEWKTLHAESLRITGVIVEMLNLRRVDHVVCAYEYQEGKWGVMLRTNCSEAIRLVVEKLKHPFAFTRVNLDKEKAWSMADRIEAKLNKMHFEGWNAEQIIDEFKES